MIARKLIYLIALPWTHPLRFLKLTAALALLFVTVAAMSHERICLPFVTTALVMPLIIFLNWLASDEPPDSTALACPENRSSNDPQDKTTREQVEPIYGSRPGVPAGRRGQ